MAERENEKEIEKEIFNLSTSESEEEEGRESDMPPPDQEPPKLPDGYGPQFSHTPLYPRSELLAIEED